MKIKILVIVLIALITQASCCGDMDKAKYEDLISPVRVYKKYDNHLVLRDTKDNEIQINKMHGGWSDSVYRNHKEGDTVGNKYVVPTIKEKKKEKGWLD